MEVKRLLNHKLMKASAIIGLSLFSFGKANAQTTVSIGTDANLIGYANWYELDGTTYAGGSVWGVPDIKTVVDTENNLIELHPNFNAYADNPGSPVWTNGDIGNKIFEGNTYVEDNTLLGQTVVFEGSCASNTLADGYVAEAFVKVLDAGYGLLEYTHVPLVSGQDFSITSVTTDYPGAAHFQYGYSVTGLNANPAQEAALGYAAVSAETGGGTTPDPVNVSIDTSSNLVAYANWFELDGTTYVNGSEWGVETLKTVVDAENNVIDLHPNFSAYADNPGDPTWVNGDIGNKIFEGNTYVQDDALAGQSIVYTGHTISNTLADGYTAIAFIKIFDANYANLQMTTAPLVGGEDFSISASAAPGSHVQYGYSVTGLNANPNQESSLGYARVGDASAATATFTTNNLAIYPNPASNVLNITAGGTVEHIAIVNMLGQKVMEVSPNQNTASVNVSALKSGMYIVNTTVDGKKSTSRFIKQ